MRSNANDQSTSPHRLRRLFAAVALVASALATIGVVSAPAAQACLGGCSNDNAQFTIITVSPTSTVYGEAIAASGRMRDFTAACLAGDCDVPTGEIQWFNQGDLLGTSALRPLDESISDWGTIRYSGLPAGDYTLRIQYVPGNFMSDSRTRDVSVSLATTTTTLAQSPASSGLGQQVTLTANVQPASTIDLAHGAHLPTGMIEFLDNGSSIASANVDEATGNAVLNWSLLDAGPHTLSARYLTDGNYDVSTSGGISHNVTKGNSAGALVQSAGTTVFGEPFTATDTVSAVPPATGTPTGQVQLNDGASPGAVLNLSGGSATFNPALSVGSHSLTASYFGDTNFLSSGSNAINHTVNKADTTTALVSPTTNPSNAFDPVTLNATIAVTAPGAGSPTGSVQFKDGAALIGAPVTVVAGTASLVTTTLGGGAHSITAVYSGDTNFNGSTSGPLSRSVNCGTTKTGTVSGTYTAPSSGTTCLTSATVTGGLTVPAGARVLISNSSVAGPLVANGGAGSITICGTSLSTVRINGANGLVTLGDPYGANGCAGNTIGGSVTLSSNTAGVRFNANHTNSLVQVTGNSGGATIIGGNTIAGSFTCSGNNPVAANGGHPNSSASRSGECASPAF